MAATTRWKDLISTSVDEFCDKALSYTPDDARNGSVFWRNINCHKLYDNTETISLNGRDVEYNVIKYRFERVSVGETIAEDTDLIKVGMIIVYKDGDGIYCIIDQNSIAKKFLRKILGYTGRNEIESWSFNLSEDFFVWIVNLIEGGNNIINRHFIDRTKCLEFKEINGIKGDTEDLLNQVSAKGESLLDTLSTLSFLKESRRINQLILEISYETHREINVVLQSNSISITNPYHGEYENELLELQVSKLYLLIYLEIIPFIESTYNNALMIDWNATARQAFKDRIRMKILAKI